MKLRRFPSGRRPKARLWVLFLSSTFAVSLCFPFSPFLSSLCSPAVLFLSFFLFFFLPFHSIFSLTLFALLLRFFSSFFSILFTLLSAFFSSFFPVLFAFLLCSFSLPFSFLGIPKLALCLRLPDAVREKKRITTDVDPGSAGRKASNSGLSSLPRI